jgi:hypothetical protein
MSGSLRLIPLLLVLSFGSTSCWFSKKKPPRVFVPPSVQPKPPTPLPQQPEVPGEPELDTEVASFSTEPPGIPASIPVLPPPPAPPKRPTPAAPKVAVQPPPPEPPPAPKLGQIFTAEQLRDYNRALDDSLERVRKALGVIARKNLRGDQIATVNRIRTFQLQAEQAREQDLVTAVNLARRADVLAQDLLQRLP